MVTKCKVSFVDSIAQRVIENVDLITTDYGVLNILYGSETPAGAARVIYAPGCWAELNVTDEF